MVNVGFPLFITEGQKSTVWLKDITDNP